MLLPQIEKLANELKLQKKLFQDAQKSIHIEIASTPISIKDLSVGTNYLFFFEADIGPLPKKNQEDLFTYIMNANTLGQGSGKGALGLRIEDNYLTLSTQITYDIDYNQMHSIIEELCNYVDFWKNELNKK